MEIQNINTFSIVGMSVRTSNENGQAGTDIPALWNKFLSENGPQQISNKIDSTLYCVYTEYEKDHTKPYTTVLGCRVENLDAVPFGMIGLQIETGAYLKRTAQGNLNEGIVFSAWNDIWSSDLPRHFTTDFEVYGEKAQNPAAAEVDIFVALDTAPR
jgi:predicted transcriptional regulator YdeE